MRLYINARFSQQRVTGVQRYAREVTQAMLDAARRESIAEPVLLAPGNAPTSRLNDIQPHDAGLLRTMLWEQAALPVRSHDGFLVNLANTAPLALHKQLVLISDASVFAVPENYSASFRHTYRIMTGSILRRAQTVVTISEFSRQEFARYYSVPADRMHIVPGGSDHITRTVGDDSIIARSGLTDRRYVLAVGTLSRAKNLALLTRAMHQLNDPTIGLALVGATDSKVFGANNIDLPPHAKMLGYTSDAELRTLYERALCFAFPSRYEGFGLPPLEAMRCGCPTLVSTAASIPEICGDASLYFDPDDAGKLASLIRQLASSPDLCDNLRTRGEMHAMPYTWQASGERFLELAQASIRNGRP